VKLKPLDAPHGLTVAQLKRHVANWPETDAQGEPTEVWLQSGDELSRQCLAIEVLNLRTRPDGTEASDLLLSYD